MENRREHRHAVPAGIKNSHKGSSQNRAFQEKATMISGSRFRNSIHTVLGKLRMDSSRAFFSVADTGLINQA